MHNNGWRLGEPVLAGERHRLSEAVRRHHGCGTLDAATHLRAHGETLSPRPYRGGDWRAVHRPRARAGAGTATVAGPRRAPAPQHRPLHRLCRRHHRTDGPRGYRRCVACRPCHLRPRPLRAQPLAGHQGRAEARLDHHPRRTAREARHQLRIYPIQGAYDSR